LDKRPEKQRQMIDMAIGNCDRLVRLVNDILDFDSGEKGKLPLRRQPVEAVDLLRRAADVAHTTATQFHIGFRIDAPPAAVIADQDRILQVLNELVTNALKFSPRDTTIRLGAHPFGTSEVCFSVEDQGRGIAPEKLERIFERFHQGDASDSRALGGTGLGLALCRSIVEQHGGRIWAESPPPLQPHDSRRWHRACKENPAPTTAAMTANARLPCGCSMRIVTAAFCANNCLFSSAPLIFTGRIAPIQRRHQWDADMPISSKQLATPLL
jgi:signal transduction histidine kinase